MDLKSCFRAKFGPIFYIFSANGDLIDQLEISEKIKSGFAIADFDENGYDDIVFGTDDDNLYLILFFHAYKRIKFNLL